MGLGSSQEIWGGEVWGHPKKKYGMRLGSPQEEIWDGEVWGHPKKDGMKILGSPGGFWGHLRGSRTGCRALGSP